MIEAYKILIEILTNPTAPKFYRMLAELYKKKGMNNESQAITDLIDAKFKDAPNN